MIIRILCIYLPKLSTIILNEKMTSNVYNGTAASFGAIASSFVLDTIEEVIVWLIVIAGLITADLVAGISKSYKLQETIRFSRAIRDSMAKFCTYYASVVCAAMTQVASHTDIEIAEKVCFIIITIEAASIFGNILKWHGYSIDFRNFIAFALGKRLGATAEEIKGFINDNNKEENGTESNSK